MITLSDLKAWLGDPAEPGVDALLTALEERAVEIVQGETDWYFGPEITHTVHLTGEGFTKLYLRARPTAITSVESRANTEDPWVAITEAGGWELQLPRPDWMGAVLLRKNGVWTAGTQYRVVYEFGYAAGDEPGDIRQAVIDIVDMLYHDRARKGLRSETIGDYSYTRFDIEHALSDPKTIKRWKGAVYAI